MKSEHSELLKRGVPCRWLITGIEKRGLNPTQLFTTLELTLDSLHDTDTILPVEDYLQLLNHSAKVLNDDHLGVHLGQSSQPEQFGLLGYLVQNAKTIANFTEIFEYYYRIFSPEFGVHFETDHEYCTFYYYHLKSDKVDSRQDIDFTMALVIQAIRRYYKPNWQPGQCTFSYSEPKNIAQHQVYFGHELKFNQQKNSFKLKKEILDIEVSHADAGLLAILQAHANQLLKNVKEKENVIDRVKVLIASNAGHQTVNTESIADHLNTSVRNLHRILQEKGTSYQNIRDETLLEIGKEALAETRTSVTDIALRLGYSESSAFVRMFKRQMGITPLQYRKQVS